MTCLTACTATAPAPHRDLPAASLLADCAEPDPPSSRTLGGLVQSVHDYQTALDRCNDDKAALRAWAGLP
ncbi:Rz1-like lysis system protein LysC [Burkholderia sp. BDU5]|uniref:Rz1-like lysis system protein LysC n=1 Tax=Burkholderia sp. BDU5 TaxID=1385590 RepID=UPI003FA4181C